MVAAARYAREHPVPCLGLCLGLQVMVIDAARHLAELDGANSTEFDSLTPHPVIDLMDDQANVVDMGGTMRLGAYPAMLAPGSQVAAAYGTEVVSERHRHRYEVNRPLPEPAGGGRTGLLRYLPRRPVGGVHRAPRPSVLGRHASPPRVQEPARPPSPVVPRTGGGCPRAGRGPGAAAHRPRRCALTALRCPTRPVSPCPSQPAGSPSWARRRSGGAGSSASPTRASPIRLVSSSERDVVHHPGAVAIVAVDDHRIGDPRAPVPTGRWAHRPRDPGRHLRRGRRGPRSHRPPRAGRGGRPGRRDVCRAGEDP